MTGGWISQPNAEASSLFRCEAEKCVGFSHSVAYIIKREEKKESKRVKDVRHNNE